jgi:HEAT repeat protein
MAKSDPEIARLLADLDASAKRTIRAAVDALIALAANSGELREILEQELTNRARNNRWPIAYVLATAGQVSPGSLEILLETLGDPDSDIRWAVLLLMVRLGKTDARIPALIGRLLDAGSPTQRRMALYCIRDLSLADDIAIPAFLKGLKDPEALVRVAGIIGLKKRTAPPETVTSRMLDLFLHDPDARVRSAAAVVLAELEMASDEFLAGLEVASRSENPQIKKAAIAALSLLQNKRSASSGS